MAKFEFPARRSNKTDLNNVDQIETIPRELKLFNLKDGLHLNKKHDCKALAGIILKSLYARLRPEAYKTGGRKNSQNKASRKNVKKNAP